MRYLDRSGREISAEEWQRLFDDPSYQVLRNITLPNNINIMLTWVGYDQYNTGLIFELAVIDNEVAKVNRKFMNEEEALRAFAFYFDDEYPDES